MFAQFPAIRRGALLSRLLRPVPVVIIFAGLLGLYAAVLHPWLMNWGSTAAERSMPLPGDDLNPNPAWQTTRAVTVNAPAGTVWAWVIQHGQDRAGFYSYDWLENLTTSDIHNVDTLRPEWQTRAVGDGIPMARPDMFGGSGVESSTLRVRIVEPGRALVTTDASNGSGAIVLAPLGEDRTRLLFRDRNGDAAADGFGRHVTGVYRWLVWDPMHFVMQHRMMLGIKARAEGHPQPPAALDFAARLGWTAAGAVTLGLFLSRRRFVPWLVLPVGVALPALLITGDGDAALAGFLGVGVTTLGALLLGWRWWPPYALVGAGVLLVLLLTPDAYIAFGLIFAAVLLIGLAWLLERGREAGALHRPHATLPVTVHLPHRRHR